MTRSTSRALAGSIALHVAGAGALVFLARVVPAASTLATAPPATVEFELRAPPTPVAPHAATEPRAAAPTEAHPPSQAASAPSTLPRNAHVAPAPSHLVASEPSAEASALPPSGEIQLPGASAEPAPAAASGARPPVSGMDLLHALSSDAAQAAQAGVIELGRPGSGHGPRDLVPREQGTPEERALAASQGYIERRLAETRLVMLPPGVPRYYWHLQRRMMETWNPQGVAPSAPSVGDAILAPFTQVGDAARQATRDALGPLADGRGRAAVEGNPHSAIADPGRTGETQVAMLPMNQTSRSTRAEIELDQDATGRVVAIRVAHSSRVRRFDDAALAAVREAVPLQSAVPMPGGRRSRWVFEVVVSRDSITSLGMSFDESRGWFEPHLPGMVHTRARVQMVSSQPLGS